MAILRVCDISKWQGEVVNWKAFYQAAIAGMYLKACEGLVVDPDYTVNLAHCRDVAMRPGAYLFLRPEVDPVKQADCVAAMAPQMAADLVPAVDIEFVKRAGADEWLKLTTPEERYSFIATVGDALAKHFGRPPRLYTSAAFVSQYLPKTHQLGRFPLWVAAYPHAEAQAPSYLPTFKDSYLPLGWKDWDMWQYGQIKLFGVGVVDASLMKG